MLSVRESNLRQRYLLRKEILDAYGGQRCICCGETIFDFLCIHHINNDGATQKRVLVGAREASGKYFSWLKRHGFPQNLGIVVMCYNCNSSLAHYGYCPHTKTGDGIPQAIWSTKPLTKRRRAEKERREKMRGIVLEHYSSGQPKCACCGTQQREFLTQDHINNDGAKDRRKLGCSKPSSVINQWLVSNNFPWKLQVLCWNCNRGKAANHGTCPHTAPRIISNITRLADKPQYHGMVCLHCGSDEACRDGDRYRPWSLVQRYWCSACQHGFSISLFPSFPSAC